MDWLKQIVDESLARMEKTPILMMTPGEVHPTMLDSSITPLDDWKGWKPVSSIITDEDIKTYEKAISYELPLTFRHFLKYKHFYSLKIPDQAVRFPRHLPDKSMSTWKRLALNSNVSRTIIERGYIYFADFNDYGLLCFDTKEKIVNNEYKIVYIDYDDPTDIHMYADNFHELLTADEEKGNRFIDYLNAYHS